MRAMILAAGRGERMRPLTDHTPKPLLKVAGLSLIEYHIKRLTTAGYRELVINTHHLGNQIRQYLGSGSRYSCHIQYSDEQPEALETGGGIFQALPLLGDQTFLVVNSDVWCDCPLAPPTLDDGALAHLILVNNPGHHPDGDFGLQDKRVPSQAEIRFTFSGIGWYRPELFATCQPGRFPLAPLLREAIRRDQVSGTLFQGLWMDIGTPERLAELRENFEL